MKRSVILLALLLASTAARAASAPRWPACAPVLTFSAKDIGVASY